MQTKEYILPNGKKAVFEYDVCGIGKITLECMDELMSMISDRPQGEWIVNREGLNTNCSECGKGFKDAYGMRPVSTYNYCPNCGCRMKGANYE